MPLPALPASVTFTASDSVTASIAVTSAGAAVTLYHDPNLQVASASPGISSQDDGNVSKTYWLPAGTYSLVLTINGLAQPASTLVLAAGSSTTVPTVSTLGTETTTRRRTDHVDIVRVGKLVPLASGTPTLRVAPADVTVTATTGATSNIVGTVTTWAPNVVANFRWSQCRKADSLVPLNPNTTSFSATATAGSATLTSVAANTLANTNVVQVLGNNASGGSLVAAGTTVVSGGTTSTIVLSNPVSVSGTVLVGVATNTFRGSGPQPSVNNSGPYATVPFSFDYNAFSALTEITLFNRQSPAPLSWYELYVDGALMSGGIVQTVSTNGNRMVLHIALTAARSHHIRLICHAVDILQVQTNVLDSIWLPKIPLYSRRAVFLGDSWTVGANDSFSRQWALDVCEQFGWECILQGQSGSGYTVTGSSGTGADVFPNRVIPLVAPETPDVVVVMGSINDNPSSPAAIGAAAALTYANLATSCPGVPVIVFGTQYVPGASGYSQATSQAIDAAISAACAAAPNVIGFVSMFGWITGTGTTAALTTTGNGNVFLSSDPAHMIDAGHRYYGNRVAHEIMALWASTTLGV